MAYYHKFMAYTCTHIITQPLLQRLVGATLLVFANKQDLPGAMSADEIREVSQPQPRSQAPPSFPLRGEPGNETMSFLHDVCGGQCDYEDSLRLRDVYWGMVNLQIMKWLQLASTRPQLQHSEHEKRAFNTFLTARTNKLPCISGQTFEPKLTIQATENNERYLRSTVLFRKYSLGSALSIIQYVGNQVFMDTEHWKRYLTVL